MNISEIELWKAMNRMRNDRVRDWQIYQYGLYSFIGTDYVRGEETPERSDCSGSVCCTLNCLYRTHIRVTAQDLYDRYFTRRIYNERDIAALFFLDSDSHVVHVAGCCGDGMYVNVSGKEPDLKGHLRTYDELCRMYSWLRLEHRALEVQKWH